MDKLLNHSKQDSTHEQGPDGFLIPPSGMYLHDKYAQPSVNAEQNPSHVVTINKFLLYATSLFCAGYVVAFFACLTPSQNTVLFLIGVGLFLIHACFPANWVRKNFPITLGISFFLVLVCFTLGTEIYDIEFERRTKLISVFTQLYMVSFAALRLKYKISSAK